MNKNRFSKSAAVLAGFVLLFAQPGMVRAYSTPNSPVQTPKAQMPKAPQKSDNAAQNDFAGLDYSDEQKAEIAKIHRDAESRKEAVAKDQTLNEDQKNALLLGYTRMEYAGVYKVLSPMQQRVVQRRNAARKAADQAAQRKSPPPAAK